MPSVHIDKLPSPGIQHIISGRSNLDPGCGRDITHFIDSDTEKEIGGVTFKGLAPDSLLC